MSCEDDDCAIENLADKATAKVFLFLAEPDVTLESGYDRIVVERSKSPTGPWKQALKVNKGIEIREDVYNYLYVDEAQDPYTWYRPVLVSTTDDDLPEIPQVARQATDTSFELFMTIEELRRIYLFGVDLTDDENAPYPHELFAHYIRAAMSSVEHDADLTLIPKKVVAQHDYWRRDFYNYGFVKLRDNPIISVTKYEVRYPSQSAILSFDTDWIRLDKHSGQVQVFPTSGTFTSLATSMFPSLLRGVDYVPGILHLEYFAGFPLGEVPELLKRYVGMQAALGPLNIAGDLVAGAGIMSKSLSIDGLSKSLSTTNSSTNAGYGARLLEYQKLLKADRDVIKRYYGGARLGVVA